MPVRLASLARAAFVSLSLLASLIASSARTTFRADPEYLIDTWETEDGLPQNSATAMVQTPDGYLWFGTWSGLTRFDGVTFTVLNPGNTPQLPSAGIVNLHLDQGGRLWVSTLTGLVTMEGGQWRSFGTNEGWAGDYVRTFAERANGNLLMTTFDGHVLEFADGRLAELPAPPGKPGLGYLAHVDEAGQWWVVQDWFVGRYDGHRWVETVRFEEPYVEGIACGTAPDGSLLLLANLELRRYRRGVEVQRVHLKERPAGVWSVTEDSAGNVWIASYAKGLSCLQLDGGFRRWPTDGLVCHSTRFVFEDRERNLWLGTSGDGLIRFKPRRFRAFAFEAGLAERAVKSISPDGSGGLWIGSFGLGLFHLREAGIANVPLADSDSAIIYAQTVLQDRARRIWVGTLGRGLWLLEAPEGRRIPAAQTGGGTIGALFEDSRGRVWIGGDKELAVFESGVSRNVEREGDFQTGGIVCMAEDEKGVLWFSNLAAVFRRDKDRFVEVRTPDGQALRDILCFKAEPAGTMWMGTRGDGLWRWRDGRISRIGSSAGFPVQAVHAILEDGLGYFWMPSNRGIVRAAQKELHAVADGAMARLNCQLLDQNDGLPSAECPTGQPTCARDANGRLWFATQKGVALVNPVEFRLNTNPPPVRIEQVIWQVPKDSSSPRALGGSMAAPFPQPLRLPPGSGPIEIHYTALSFSASEKVRLQVKLDGHDTGWQDQGNLRVANFYSLPPKDYVFRVRAANNDGVWNETGTRLAFTVLPFYWQTIWFRVAMGLLLMASGGGAVRWRNGVKRRLELAEMEHVRRESAERQRADEKFRLAVEASPNGIALTNSEGHILLVNLQTERLFGYTRDELIGTAIERLIPERFRSAHPGHRAKFFAAPSPRSMGAGRELFALRKDGTEFPVEIGLSPIQTAEGVLVLAAIVDLTTRKQSELELLQQRNQLTHLSRVTTLGEISGSLAHELNQPLGAILVNTEAAELHLQSRKPNLEEVRAILADIRKDDLRAGEIIHGIRAFLRRKELEIQPLEVGRMAEEVVKLISADAAAHKTSVGLEIATNLPRVMGDRVHLQQVLLNLLVNGMDAMTTCPVAERRITIRATRPDAHTVELAVRDAGVGIPPGELGRVFDPFHTTKQGGLGLGLSICRSIVEAHGGSISIQNNRDRGTTARFSLPACQEGDGTVISKQSSVSSGQ